MERGAERNERARTARAVTVRSRTRIGFPTRKEWRDAPAQLSAHTLTICGHPVMEDWEDEYMRDLARIAGSRGGTVLEVGFGMGISARHLQQQAIERHVIIEANAAVYETLREFAAAAAVPIEPLSGYWEELTPLLPSSRFDGILFDTYPLTEAEIHRNHFPFFKEAYRLLRPGGVLTYYSDEALDFSSAHQEALRAAGFTHLDKRIRPVAPPPGCDYWREPTLMAPYVWK